jgi:hypothetical protein
VPPVILTVLSIRKARKPYDEGEASYLISSYHCYWFVTYLLPIVSIGPDADCCFSILKLLLRYLALSGIRIMGYFPQSVSLDRLRSIDFDNLNLSHRTSDVYFSNVREKQ